MRKPGIPTLQWLRNRNMLNEGGRAYLLDRLVENNNVVFSITTPDKPNPLGRIAARLLCFKFFLFGDKELSEKGYKIIPCSDCGGLFISRVHYDTAWSNYCYDTQCENCRKRNKIEED
jgi:hypothetical protein